jgi:hypothetical protein
VCVVAGAIEEQADPQQADIFVRVLRWCHVHSRRGCVTVARKRCLAKCSDAFDLTERRCGGSQILTFIPLAY